MPEANISEIVEKLRARDDQGASSQFIEIFSGIVRNYLRYKKWVDAMIRKNGTYQGKGREHIIPGYFKYIEMIEDIAANGIKKPIQKVSDPCGYEIDGYHRLIIWKELGNETIPVKTPDGK